MSACEDQVREYLRDCMKASAWLAARGSALDPRYHPTAGGAVKMIPHRGDPAGAQAIRQAFRDLTATPSA